MTPTAMSAPRTTARWRWRDHPHVIPRGRDGRSLAGEPIAQLLLPGESLSPATRRVLRVLASDEGKAFTFADLADLASVGTQAGSAHDRANILHRHVYLIRLAMIAECWIDSVMGMGFMFRRRATAVK
jgi:hypothetical protein